MPKCVKAAPKNIKMLQSRGRAKELQSIPNGGIEYVEWVKGLLGAVKIGCLHSPSHKQGKLPFYALMRIYQILYECSLPCGEAIHCTGIKKRC